MDEKDHFKGVFQIIDTPGLPGVSIVVEGRAPRVYPWVNERDGGILYA